jgi:hypothetical protein
MNLAIWANIGEKEDLTMSKISPIGIIAEDDSDVICLKILIQRIIPSQNICVKKFVGKGCGKIKRKCNAWANQLSLRGCKVLFVVHDLDFNNINDLRLSLKKSLEPSPIKKHLICVPIQEMEAWLLSDPEAIKLSLNLSKAPNVKGRPEEINSPKEYLGEIIAKASNNEKIYINTKHNEKIVCNISIDKIQANCPSFKILYDFVEELKN